MIKFKKFKLDISITVNDERDDTLTENYDSIVFPIYWINYESNWYKIIHLSNINYKFPNETHLNSSSKYNECLNAIKKYLFENTYNKEQLEEKILKLI